MLKINISILIPAYNEELNIRSAIESVKWADDIFVVDSFSSDKTLEIAKKYPNVKTLQHKFENYSKQKNWALDNLPIESEWVFILDADERITENLKKEILETISRPEDFVAFYINRRFIFLGKWIKHCGWYPSWNLRLFKKGKARYEERSVNEHMISYGKTGYLKNDMLHENLRPLADWLEKHNKYSTLEAEEFLNRKETGLLQSFFSKDQVSRKRAVKEKIFYKLPFKPFFLFLYLYIFRLGFLDGRVGFVFCCLRAIQQFNIDVKIKELIIKKHVRK